MPHPLYPPQANDYKHISPSGDFYSLSTTPSKMDYLNKKLDYHEKATISLRRSSNDFSDYLAKINKTNQSADAIEAIYENRLDWITFAKEDLRKVGDCYRSNMQCMEIAQQQTVSARFQSAMEELCDGETTINNALIDFMARPFSDQR